MPRVLVLAAHRPGRSPSQRFRFEQFMRPLKAHGFDFELSNLLDAADDGVFYGNGSPAVKAVVVAKSALKRLADCRRFRDFDIVFVQREAWMLGSTFFERRIKGSGAKFVFDFDDSIWLMDTSAANKRWEWLKNPRKTEENIRLADLVFAGNPYLADFARQLNPNVHVVPTTIDTEAYTPAPFSREKSPLTVGWSGSVTTIRHFEFARPALSRVKDRFGDKAAFQIIGDGTFRDAALGIAGLPWRPESEVDDLRRFDIGIMPLPNDDWARGKCGLKGLQYMALGIPTVMSPVGVNSDIIRHGENGYLAGTDEEWLECLSLLLESPDLRKRIGDAGRATVQERYSVAANIGRYKDLLGSLLA